MERGTFVGRDAELGELERTLVHAEARSGSNVLIGGPPGIGKTRLADELASRAAGRGAAVLWGRSWEGGGAPAYWPWTEAVGTLAELVPGPGTTKEEIAPWAGLDADSARFGFFDSVTSFLVDASAERPLVLVLEDVHACDTASLLLLRFVARRVADSRIVLVATYRDTELGEDAAAAVEDVMRERRTHAIRLRGLSPDAIARMIEEATGTTPGERLVGELHGHTHGNPLFLGEAIRQAVADGDPLEAGVAAAVPRELRKAVVRGLDRLSSRCRDVLSLAAVVGREFRVPVLALADGRPEAQVLAAMEEARAAGVVETDRAGWMRFSHGLTREVLYDVIPPSRRAHLHRRIGDALERLSGTEDDAPVAELAHHFLRAPDAGDRAARYAKAAGDRAGRLLAYEEAVRHYRSALEAGAHDRRDVDRCELLLALGDALARAGEEAEAREVFLQAAEAAERAGDAGMLAGAALGYGGRFVWARAGGDPHVRGLLERALSALAPSDTALRARVMARLAGVLRDEPEREPRWSLSADAVAMARRLEDVSTLAYALESRWAAIWEPATTSERMEIADELVELAERGAEPERALQAHGHRLHTLFELGDVEGVRAEHRIERRLLETVRQPAQRWLVAVGSAALALFDGSFADAERLISEAAELGRRAQGADAEVSFRLQTYILRRETGGAETMEPLIRESIDEFPWYPMFRCVVADLCARTGRRDEARDVLASLSAEGFGGLPVDSQWLFSMTLLADAAAETDDAERASELYELLLPSASLTAYGPPEVAMGTVARALGGLAATVGRWDDAERHLESAIAAERSMKALPWLAHSYLGLAAALLGRGRDRDEDRAASLLADAARIAERLGMTPLVERIARLRGEGSGRADQPGGASAVFRREGDTWTIAYEGRTFRLSDSKGLRYLAELLRNPGREILALDLAAAGLGERRSSGEGLETEGATGADVLDPEARRAYKRRLGDLRDELEEAESWSDGERAARAREEMEFLTRELAAATGLGGRSRKTGSPAERARQSVTKALRLAIDRLKLEDDRLGEHLEATVRTGTFCSYTPDPRAAVAWRR